jgi:hypothetical protein
MVTAGLLASLHLLSFGGLPGSAPAVDRFEPRLMRDLVGWQDVDFDSGWFPMDSPVQLRFYAHAADSIVIEMLGDGLYDWTRRRSRSRAIPWPAASRSTWASSSRPACAASPLPGRRRPLDEQVEIDPRR